MKIIGPENIKLYSSALALDSFNLKKECYKNTETYSQEVCTSPMSFFQAEAYLAQLMYQSGAFFGGSKPVVGRLKGSYGCGKIIGSSSFDNQVVTRIDFDPSKGYHLNFIDYRTNQKIAIIISDMNENMYRRYIDRLTYGRNTGKIDKRNNIRSTVYSIDPMETMFTEMEIDEIENEDSYEKAA